MICPTCHLPVSLHDDNAHCTVPAWPQRRAILAAQLYRTALVSVPLDYQARREMLAQVDEQISYLEGAYV